MLSGNRGFPPNAKMRKASTAALEKRTAARAALLAPVIAELQAAGATSLKAIAAGLNERKIPTARGDGEWTGDAGHARHRSHLIALARSRHRREELPSAIRQKVP